MNTILSREWWRAAGLRALKTALALAVPYLGASLIGDVPWLTIVSTALLGAILSLLTSLLGIPDSAGVPLWVTLLEKTVKTFAQSLVAGIGNIVLFQDVDWSTVLQTSAIATLATLVIVVVGKIPDVNPTPVPVAIEPSTTRTLNMPVNLAATTAATNAVDALIAPRPPSGTGV